MSIRLRDSGPKLGDLADVPTRVMRTIGEQTMARIRLRTKKGVDADGRAFRALSPGYAVQKRTALGHGRADLEVSGRMLNDMILRPRPARFTITFASGGSGSARGGTFIQRSRAVGAADKAFYHNVSGAGAARTIREFFALGDSDVEFIRDKLLEYWDKEARG